MPKEEETVELWGGVIAAALVSAAAHTIIELKIEANFFSPASSVCYWLESRDLSVTDVWHPWTFHMKSTFHLPGGPPKNFILQFQSSTTALSNLSV